MATLARLPCPGSTKVAYDLLLEVAEESIPGGSNADDDDDGRKRFDETADAMLVTLAKKRREEEGDDFKFADTLEKYGQDCQEAGGGYGD